jgi:MoaA/NifB/PqqE/SkfB family radical SAM enzyme
MAHKDRSPQLARAPRSFVKITRNLPVRLPLEGFLDVTYRCNNNCRHCWLYTPDTPGIAQQELTFEEIKDIVDQARALGCRTWAISGGEPMLREDFGSIIEYIAEHSSYYSLNTNGSRITPAIAKILRRKGNKWVALYGATAAVHDHITRRPGSYEETLRGMALLKEAGAFFTAHIVPMRDSYHQVQAMIDLMKAYGYEWRLGTTWFYLSASGDSKKNQEIDRQRLTAEQMISIDDIEISRCDAVPSPGSRLDQPDGKPLFAACIKARKDFHIDPYGYMSFCSLAKDPLLRYDLRKGSLAACWEDFIPSLVDKIRAGETYRLNCGSCDLRSDCSWCAVYSYLESGTYDAKIPSLCLYAQRRKALRAVKEKSYQRFYHLAGVTIQVQADVPLDDATFDRKFQSFATDDRGAERVVVRHRLGLPPIDWDNPGEPVYVVRPWAVYRKNDAFIYCMDVNPGEAPMDPVRIAVTNREHTRINIFHRDANCFPGHSQPSLTTFPTDIILFGHTMAYKQACYLHSSAMILDGRGVMFLGPSGAGKSTMAKILQYRAKLLCDDRNVVRRWPDGFRVHGTWNHGELPEVHPDSAPLAGLFFLHKAGENRIERLTDSVAVHRRILQCLFRPVQTPQWWSLTLDLVGNMVDRIPVYALHFSVGTQTETLIDDLKTTVRSSALETTNEKRMENT